MSDKLLFTPGPLTTTPAVKHAMLRDLGSRDAEFLQVVRDIRERLLALAGVDPGVYAAVPMQGSGTFAIESVIGSAIPPDGRLLVAVNGVYGRRMVEIARRLGIDTVSLEFPEDQPVDPGQVAGCLEQRGPFSHVAVVHCETTTGMLNPIEEVGAAVEGAGAALIVDAMSSFGGIPIDATGCRIDYLVSSSNKCIQGVPGFAFVIANRRRLLQSEGWARSVALDLAAQWRGLETNGQFRFTPPTHALLAFHAALDELAAEGGIAARQARYARNHAALMEEMEAMGFVPYLRPEHRSPIITSFRYPKDPRFRFDDFYAALSRRGFVIYPGKLAREDCFRIGTIGHLSPGDVRGLAAAIREVLAESGIELRR
jgi:2-aminoethylphosphonate-pyruvate transaminase